MEVLPWGLQGVKYQVYGHVQELLEETFWVFTGFMI